VECREKKEYLLGVRITREESKERREKELVGCRVEKA
jgi:hypothetical protein